MEQQRLKTLIFLHLPKCGGTSMLKCIRNLRLTNPEHNIRGSIDKNIAVFKCLDPEARHNIGALMGHMGFGLHKYVRQPSHYFILFRDPVQRVISEYFYVRRRKAHYFYHYLQRHSLLEFVKSGIGTHCDNQCVRMVSRTDGFSCISREMYDFPDGIPAGHCTLDMLEKAMEHTARPDVTVGLLEDVDDTVRYLSARFGRGQNIVIPHANKTPRPSDFTLTPEVEAAIREYNPLDVQLYEHVKLLYAQQKEALWGDKISTPS